MNPQSNYYYAAAALPLVQWFQMQGDDDCCFESNVCNLIAYVKRQVHPFKWRLQYALR